MKVKDIADHYGLTNQLHQTQEECGELVQAISKYFRTKDKPRIAGHIAKIRAISSIVEEIADVEIMTSQIKYLMQIEQEVTDMKVFKVERQLERIKEETEHKSEHKTEQ